MSMMTMMRFRKQPRFPAAHEVRSSALSVRGARRAQNEDCVLANDQHGIFAVADGMGGRTGGREASRILCSSIQCELTRMDATNVGVAVAESMFQHATTVAIARMRKLSDLVPVMKNMGTTLVAGWQVDGRLYYAHAGDSRLYLARRRRLTQLTKDHSIVAEMRSAGLLAARDRAKNPWRHWITRSIGPSSHDSRIDVNSIALRSSDRLIFLSDGIWSVLPDRSIIGAANLAASPNELCHWLVTAAKEAKGHDDMSCVVVDYNQTSRD